MQQIEQLETRRLLASFTASTVAELIADINATNAAGGANSITLAPGTTFKLTAVYNNTSDPNGLPVIAAGNELTIVGNGDTIQRSTAKGTPAFRLFEVARGGSLALNNLTLSNGLSLHPSVATWGAGGAIISGGTLSLTGVMVENSIAKGKTAYPAFGGGIYSSGVLSIADSTIRNNQAIGGVGLNDFSFPRGGGTALGGGLYLGGGTATITNTIFSSNLARGGDGAGGQRLNSKFGPSISLRGTPGGDGRGGGIYAASGMLDLRANTITQNSAVGGIGGNSPGGLPKGADGLGQGGGVYIAPGAAVGLDSVSQGNTTGNTASTSDNDIFGSFTVLG
jgi:hypothetical protein